MQNGATLDDMGKAFTRDATGAPEGVLGTLFDLLQEAE